MPKAAELEQIIADALYPIKAYDLSEVCILFDLKPPDADDPFASKNGYRSAVGTGGKHEFTDSKAEIPDTFSVMLEYAGSPTVLLISSLANDTKVDHVLRGHKATLVFTPTGFTITPQKLFAKEMQKVVYEKKGSESLERHRRNLMAAIRTGEAPKCDAAFAFKGLVACELGMKSFRERKYLGWDAGNGRIVRV